MRDEKETLRRLIEQAVDDELRHRNGDARDLPYRIAREVLRRLDSMRIQVTSST